MKIMMIRHGKPDYECLDKKTVATCSKNIAPLTEQGKWQATKVAENEQLKDAQLIISSPYCRALETAHIIATINNLPIVVEPMLHEWESDEDFNISDKHISDEIEKEFIKNKGKHNNLCKYYWESLDALGQRAKMVLDKYAMNDKIVVVSHAMLMRQFLYKKEIRHCELIEVDYETIELTGFKEEY